MRLTFIVNNKQQILEVPGDKRLIDILRDDLGLTGTKEGCGEGVSCLNPTVALEDSACIDLTALVASGYLADVPIDPNCDGASAGATRYYFIKHATGSMITIGSCCEEQGSNSSIPDISITK